MSVEASMPKEKLNVRRIIEILLETLLISLTTFAIVSLFQNSTLALPIGGVAAILSLLRLWLTPFFARCFDVLYQWRWLIALTIFVVAVAFQLHLSNAASYLLRFEGDPSVEESILFGIPRAFRTDEYNVQLPYYFSQFFNHYEQISYQMSMSGQDMIVGYNAPVLGPTLIGKPFIWGYILLGNAYGISWYFMSKTILMFMVSLELFFILTKSRHMAVFGSFLFTFAPASVWWFSPHFYDAIFWSCALFVVGYYFFATQGWIKWLFTILAISALTGFTLALFPSLQVPCGILMFFLMVACLYRDRQNLVWHLDNILNIACVILGLGFILIPTLVTIWEPLELLWNTEYPGSRISLGGDGVPWKLFFNTLGIFQPFVNFAVPSNLEITNNSEISSYTHFGIAFMMFYPYLWNWMRKKKLNQRYVGDVLFLAMCLQILFFFVEFPEWLAKITLLSLCNRTQTVFGVTGTLLTIWIFQILKTQPIPRKALVGLLICIVYGFLSCYLITPDLLEIIQSINPFFEQWGEVIFYAIPILIAFGLWLSFTKWRQIFFCLLICWTAVAGLLVNPLMQGTAAITDYPLAHVVQEEVKENPNAWWLSLGGDQIQGLLLANGAKVINAVNFYPDLEKWKLLELDDEDNFNQVNRYAHFLVNLTLDEPTYVSKADLDLIDLEFNPEDFKTLDIQYVVGLKSDEALLTQADIPYKILYEDKKTQDVVFDLDVSPKRADNHKELQQAQEAREEQARQESLERENSLQEEPIDSWYDDSYYEEPVYEEPYYGAQEDWYFPEDIYY